MFLFWLPVILVFVGVRWLAARSVGLPLFPVEGRGGARVFIALAGSIGCVLLSVLALIAANLIEGTALPGDRTVIEEVAPGSPAQAAGVLPDDLIVAIDGHAIAATSEVAPLVHAANGRSMALTVERDHAPRTITLVPIDGRIGVTLGSGVQMTPGVGLACSEGVRQWAWLWTQTYESLISPRREVKMVGAVGIVTKLSVAKPTIRWHLAAIPVSWMLVEIAAIGLIVSLAIFGIRRRRRA